MTVDASKLLIEAQKISSSSPAIKAFAIDDANVTQGLAAEVTDLTARVAVLEAAPLAPAPIVPVPVVPIFAQGYQAADMQSLLTAGDLVRVAADRLVAVDATHCRFEVRSGDAYLSWSGERSQIQRPDILGQEGDRWHWKVPFMLDAGFQFSTGFYNVLWEHHHQGSTGSPPFTIQIHNGRIVMRVTTDTTPGNDWTEYDLGPATPGIAQVLDVNCLLSSDPTKAATVCALDNNPPASATGHRNIYAGLAVYPMWGLYRAASPLTQVVTFGSPARYA